MKHVAIAITLALGWAIALTALICIAIDMATR